MTPILDPELVRQLSVSTSDTRVEAVVRLRPEPGTTVPAPEETERLTRELVTRTQKASGDSESAVNVFRHLGSFAISARPAFLKALLQQPEVAAALANKQPDSGIISPVEKRPARLDEIGTDGRRRAKSATKRAPRRARTPRTGR